MKKAMAPCERDHCSTSQSDLFLASHYPLQVGVAWSIASIQRVTERHNKPHVPDPLRVAVLIRTLSASDSREMWIPRRVFLNIRNLSH